MLTMLLLSCGLSASVTPPTPPTPPTPLSSEAGGGDCSKAKNVCPDYAPSWGTSCPVGERCITFQNACEASVALSYQVGCNGDGTPGAPQCNCSAGPVIPPDGSVTFTIVDANYKSCLPSWQPPCLTAGLAVIANEGASSCASGTRVEFTAGNAGDVYGRFDSYDIDVEKDFYSIPVSFGPDIACAVDHANHDCRTVFCASPDCPDAYSTPTSGGCPDGRSPQVGCQDTFGLGKGYTVTFCPARCTAALCPSCSNAIACP